MDALEYMFSVAREGGSSVLEFKPEYIMQENLMSLSSKFPLIPGSQRSIKFCTTQLSQKLRETPADADFDLTDPYSPPPQYNVLHDPHLKDYFQNPAMQRRLVGKGFITNSGFIKCTLLEFNMFRQWIRKLKLDRIHQERRRQRQLELQLWKERQARERLLRDEELYSIMRLRKQKAKELKERSLKRRETEKRKYLKLQELDRKRREEHGDAMKQKKDKDASEREKHLAYKQLQKNEEENKGKEIKISLLVRRSSEDKKRESMLQRRRRSIMEEKELRIKENWKRRCSLSLVRQEEKRKQEEDERLEFERNVARRTSIAEKRHRKSQVQHELCLQKRRNTLVQQHHNAEMFLDKIREKKLRDLDEWRKKHARMLERHQKQGRRVSLQTKASGQGQGKRRRSQSSSVWDLQSSLEEEFGIKDNVIYSGVVFAGKKAKHEAREGDRLENFPEESTYQEAEEMDKFEKLWLQLGAEFALREKVHHIVFDIILNASEALDRDERQKVCRKVSDYVQGVINFAQERLANDQSGDLKPKVRKYVLQVIENASLVVDEVERWRLVQEIVATAINGAREEVISLHKTAKEVVATAIERARQEVALQICRDLFECAEAIVAGTMISATQKMQDAQEVNVARSLAIEAVKAAKGSIEHLHKVELEPTVDEEQFQFSTSLAKCAKELTTAAIISATKSSEQVSRKDDSDLMAARSLACDAVAAAKSSLQKLYGVKIEVEDEDQEHYVTISKCLVKSAKDIAQAAVSIAETFSGQYDLEGLTARKRATDSMYAAKVSLEKLDINVEDKDDNEQAYKDIASAALVSAARSLQKDFLTRETDLVAAAQTLAHTALESAKESLEWFYRAEIVPEARIEGKTHRLHLELGEVARDIAEVVVDSATRSLEQIMGNNEWNLISTTHDLVSDVIGSAKASLESFYGVTIKPEEEVILSLQQASENSLEYSIFSTSASMEILQGDEKYLCIAARSLARDALKSAKASIQRLNNIADQMEENIKQTAFHISKTLMDSSGNLLQKLEREGLTGASRDLACSAIESAAKSFSKFPEDETSLQKIAEDDSGLLNAAAKVSTVSVRASLGEFFDRGFIGDQELEEATDYLATHAVLSAENLLDSLQGEISAGSLDLEICKVAKDLALNTVVSAERSITCLAEEHQEPSAKRSLQLGTLFWKVTTYVEQLINGALRNLGAEWCFVHMDDDSEEYEELTHDEARLADKAYNDQREILMMRASKIVQNAIEIAKSRTACKSFFLDQPVADGKPHSRRKSSVHFNETSVLHSRRDNDIPRDTDYLCSANRPPTPRFRKDRLGSVVSQAVEELEKELAFSSGSDITEKKSSSTSLVRRRLSDPGPEFCPEDISIPRTERSVSDSSIDHQGTALDIKGSLYDILKKREESASCEISPSESYVVLPHLNLSELSLIAARVEAYECLWKQKATTPSVTSLPSLSPKSSFVASAAAEHVNSDKETKILSASLFSRLPDISKSASKICKPSSSSSSLKGPSAYRKQTSLQKLNLPSKTSLKASKESVKVQSKSSTGKALHSSRTSAEKVSSPVSSRSSLSKKEGTRQASGENVTLFSPKSSVKDASHSQRTSDAKVVHSSHSSLTKATVSPRTSVEKAVISKGRSSKTQIKTSPKSSKLYGSIEKTTTPPTTSLQRGLSSPRRSIEKVALNPSESKQKKASSTGAFSQKVVSSPTASKESVVSSSTTSKRGTMLSASASTGNATLSPRRFKGNITRSRHSSSENASLSQGVSTEAATISPHNSLEDMSLLSRGSTEDTVSRRASKGKDSKPSSTSFENTKLSLRSSKRDATQLPSASPKNTTVLSRISKEKITQSSRNSSERIVSNQCASKGLATQSSNAKISRSPNISKENAQVSLLISSEEATSSSGSNGKAAGSASSSPKAPGDTELALSMTSMTIVKTHSSQSAKDVQPEESTMKTEPTDGKLSEDLVRSPEKVREKTDPDGFSSPVEDIALRSDFVQVMGEEPMESKNIEITKDSTKDVRSLERLIQDKRFTPEGAEAGSRSASSVDMTTMRRSTDPTGEKRVHADSTDKRKRAKSILTAPDSTIVSPKSSIEKAASMDSEREVVAMESGGKDERELQGVFITSGDKRFSQEGDKKGQLIEMTDSATDGKQVQQFSTKKTATKSFEGYPLSRKVSVSRSIHDTLDDIVQKMLDTTDEPTKDLSHSRSLCLGPCKEFRCESEGGLGMPRLSKGRLPTGKVSRTVMDTVDFMLQSVSSYDNLGSRKGSGRHLGGGVSRTISSMDNLSRGSTLAQNMSRVHGISPSPPTSLQPKVPSPRRSLLIATSSQDSMGVRATQSDSTILSSSSDKAVDLKPKVSGAWLDGAMVASGVMSDTANSPMRPSSSPAPSQHRRASQGSLSAKTSLDGVCLERNNSIEKGS